MEKSNFKKRMKSTLSVLLLLLFIVDCIGPATTAFIIQADAAVPVGSTAMTDEEHEPILSESTISSTSSGKKKIKKNGDENADGNRILLIQNSLPWDSNANSNLLSSLMTQNVIVGYDICTVAEFGTLDLAKYAVISIANDQTTSTYDQCADIIKGLEFFVQGGGVVIFGACDRGWGGNGNLSIDLPLGLKRIEAFHENNYIADSNHPIVTAEYSDQSGLTTSSLIGGTYCSHTSFDPSSLPANAHTILCDEDQNPTLVEYPYGDGLVIASGLTWEYYYVNSRPDFSTKVFDDLYLYALKSSNLKYDELVLNSRADNYIVKVVDSAGAPVENATLQLYVNDQKGNSYQSNSIGVVQFPKSGSPDEAFLHGKLDFEILKKGYKTYSTKDTNYEYNENGYEVIVLYSEAESGNKLRSAYYIDTTADYKPALLSGVTKTNLITGTKRLSKTNESILDAIAGDKVETGHFQIVCTPVDLSGVKNYELWQGAIKIAESVSGTFNLKIKQFNSGKNVFVRVNGIDGVPVDTKLNLEICEDKKNDSGSISFGSKIKFSVSDDVPFVGGSDISLDIPDLPFEVEYEDGKLYFEINIKKFKTDSLNGVEKKKTMKEQYEDIKKSINDVKRLSKYKVGSYLDRSINNFLKEKKKFDLPVVGKLDVKIFGCGTVDWTPGEALDKITLQLCIIVDGSINKTWQTMVSVVPVVIDITAGVEIKFAAGATWNFKAKTLNGDVTLNIKPYLEAFGGVGVGKFIGVGVYGKADLDCAIQLIGSATPFGINSVDLTGELGLKAYAGPFEYSKDFAYNTWHLYTRTKVKSPALRRSNALYDAEIYQIQDLNYLQNQSSWGKVALRGKKKNARAFNSDFITLVSDTYRNTQPMLVTNGDIMMIVMVSADATRDVANASVVQYSIFDPDTGFAEPVQVDKNNTADSNIEVLVDGSEIYIAYQDTAKTFTDDSIDVQDYVLSQNIVVAKYNRETGAFDTLKTFSDNASYYRYPKLAKIGGQLYLVWIASAGTDLFGQEESRILYSVFDNSWSKPETLDTTSAICDYAVSEVNGAFAVLCSLDSDLDFSTLEDRELTLFTEGSNSNVAQGETLTLRSLRLPGMENDSFIWVQNGTLYAYENGDAVAKTQIGSPESVAVIGDSLYVTLADDGASQIFAVNYNSETDSFGEPVPVTAQEKYIEKLTAVSFDGSDYMLMTRKDVLITDDLVEDSCELALFCLAQTENVSLTFAEFEQEQVSPGNMLPVNLYVKNNGFSNVKSLLVTVQDENGEPVYEETAETCIASGTESIVPIQLLLPEGLRLSSYEITVLDPDAEEDCAPDDNTLTINLGYTDLKLNVEMQKVQDGNFAVVDVSNEGATPSDGIVKMACGDTVLQYVGFEELQHGEHQIIMLDLDREAFDQDEVILDFYVTAYRDEYYDYNNAASAYLNFNDVMYDEVKSVSLNNKAEKLLITDTLQLQYVIAPDNAKHGELGFYSSDPEVAAVDETGTVQPFTVGKTTVSVFVDGKTDSFELTVYCEHAWDAGGVTTPASCSQDGEKTFLCSICKGTKTESIPAVGHQLTKTDLKEATCIQPGNIEYYTCSMCQKTFSDAKGTKEIKDVTVKSTGHSFGEWEVTKEATTAEEGIETRKCSKCGKEETRPIGKLIITYTLGDVDGDGNISAADARLALRRSVGLENYEEGSPAFLACDVDLDGNVTVADARLILRASVGLEDPKTWVK